MKKISFLVALLLICSSIAAYGQDRKPFKVKIVTEKGKPYRSDGKNFLYLESDRVPFILAKDGTCMLNANPNDTVIIAFANYRGAIPVNGMDSVVLTVNKDKLYRTSSANETEVSDGYQMVKRTATNVPISSFEVENMAGGSHIYKDLADLIRGRFAGVSVSPDGRSVLIRGLTSLTASNQPLVVIDGQNTTWESANRMNPQDIKSIDVLKDGSLYGMQGAAGVIIITTKRGK